MSILIYIDQAEGHVKKASLEALSYGAALASQMGTTAEGLVLGASREDLASLGAYGVKKVHQVAAATLDHMDAQVNAQLVADAATALGLAA